MDTEPLTRLVMFLIFAGAGYLLSVRVPAPNRMGSWLVWLAALLAADHIGVTARLVSIPGFTLYFNNFLQGLIFGLILGFFEGQGARAACTPLRANLIVVKFDIRPSFELLFASFIT